MILGLNEKEKGLDVLEYNHTLFENMAHFVDAVWEINVRLGTVYILHDKLTKSLSGRQLSMDEIEAFVIDKSHPKYKDKAMYYISEEYLLNLKEQEEITIKVIIGYTYHTVRISVTPTLNEFGDVEVVYATVQDIQNIIDKQKISEKSQEELDRYLSSVSCGIIQYTRDTHKIEYINDIALSILGYSSIEEMQNDDFDGVVKTVNEEDSIKIKNLIKDIRTEENVVQCEYRVKHKDGKEIYCIGKIRMINRGDKEPLIQRSMIDITPMRKAGLAYKQTADTLGVANLGLWHFILDEGAPKFFVDDVASRLVGVSVNSSPEDTYSFWYNSLSTETKELVNSAVLKMRNGQPAEVTYPYNHPTRGVIYIRCGGLVDTSYNGKGVMIRGYHQDITDYNQRLFEQIEVSRAATKYFSGVCSIDLNKGTTKFVSNASGHFINAVSKERPIESIMEVLYAAVADESKDDLRRIDNIDFLKDKLTEKESYTISIKMKDGIYKLTFVAIGCDDDGNVEKCVLFVEG